MPFELISFKTGGEWIGKLWSKFKSIKSKYEQEINEINNIMFVDPEELAKYYVEPNCQEINPADQHEERFLTASEPVMRKIDQFFGAKVFQPGDNQLFVLSDAGMGKSALLTMLKLMHLTAFWPPDKDCVLKKLGKKTLDEISEIKEKRDTILLLDSLDEDPTAYGRVRDRLSDILQATQAFFRVIITCGTQFFPSDVEHDPFTRPGVALVSGFRCPVRYLSFFDNTLVMKYLSKRFPKKFWWFTDKKKIEEAMKVIAKMGSLRCHPMLLSYIEELTGSPLLAKEDSEYQVYDALIESWLNREKAKHPDISKENLSDASIILATVLQMNGLREISEDKLDKLIPKLARLRPVKEIELKARSFLNRNSEGDYRFSHYSIQEFLVAKLLLSDKPLFHPVKPIHLTDFIFRMILMSKKVPNFINLLDFQGLNLRKFDLPVEILVSVDDGNDDFEKIRNYFIQRKREGEHCLYEAKLLIVGEAGAGKTTLAKKIKYPSYDMQEDEKSTEGINVIPYEFPLENGKTFRVNIWDFGGQEIYHATHQFFLTKRSLYILVADTRKEDTDFYYWLNVVRLLSDSSPLLIIKNEKQDREIEIPENQLRGQFKNLKETLPANFANNRGLDEIIDKIKYFIKKLPHIGTILPQKWGRVREVLENDPRNHITFDEYIRICEQSGFKLLKDKLQLSGYLHDLGVCLHFQDDPILKRIVILKPQWGTNAVYKVLDSKIVIDLLK